eukprot:CAMPEP_0174265522 /NCGR_PEP_ID=MMETSP0439-20130205/26806_1 /TAXON_ID=0 /ORGANISM="Stereomyxa ramosa, Strain Chinc5" /LENGTH=702 /DNA_ID=CAMNT_0015352021 /DNA_START=554 /DNA_END=2659 /DNA_ORIENTATION=-
MTQAFFPILDGISMGSGLCLGLNSPSFSVVTERGVYAFPGTAFGWFPDCRASILCSKLPGHMGLFLALTGKRIKAWDLIHGGLATHYMASEELGGFYRSLESKLMESSLSKQIMHTVDCFAVPPKNQPFFFLEQGYLDNVNRCFSKDSIEDIMIALEKDYEPWSHQVLNTLKAASPLSLHITFGLYQLAKSDPSKVLALEKQLANKILKEGKESDFYEGLEALLVHQRTPNWKHQDVFNVSRDEVDHYIHLSDDVVPPPPSLPKPKNDAEFFARICASTFEGFFDERNLKIAQAEEISRIVSAIEEHRGATVKVLQQQLDSVKKKKISLGALIRHWVNLDAPYYPRWIALRNKLTGTQHRVLREIYNCDIAADLSMGYWNHSSELRIPEHLNFVRSEQKSIGASPSPPPQKSNLWQDIGKSQVSDFDLLKTAQQMFGGQDREVHLGWVSEHEQNWPDPRPMFLDSTDLRHKFLAKRINGALHVTKMRENHQKIDQLKQERALKHIYDEDGDIFFPPHGSKKEAKILNRLGGVEEVAPDNYDFMEALSKGHYCHKDKETVEELHEDYLIKKGELPPPKHDFDWHITDEDGERYGVGKDPEAERMKKVMIWEEMMKERSLEDEIMQREVAGVYGEVGEMNDWAGKIEHANYLHFAYDDMRKARDITTLHEEWAEYIPYKNLHEQFPTPELGMICWPEDPNYRFL